MQLTHTHRHTPLWLFSDKRTDRIRCWEETGGSRSPTLLSTSIRMGFWTDHALYSYTQVSPVCEPTSSPPKSLELPACCCCSCFSPLHCLMLMSSLRDCSILDAKKREYWLGWDVRLRLSSLNSAPGRFRPNIPLPAFYSCCCESCVCVLYVWTDPPVRSGLTFEYTFAPFQKALSVPRWAIRVNESLTTRSLSPSLPHFEGEKKERERMPDGISRRREKKKKEKTKTKTESVCLVCLLLFLKRERERSSPLHSYSKNPTAGRVFARDSYVEKKNSVREHHSIRLFLCNWTSGS